MWFLTSLTIAEHSTGPIADLFGPAIYIGSVAPTEVLLICDPRPGESVCKLTGLADK